MAKEITAKKFASNVIISIIAQIISLAVSFILTLIVPKFIDEYQYAYWQTYVLYVGYVGVLHFGLLDGLVLRYSKYDYEELDKARLRSQFTVLLIFTCATTLISSGISLLAFGDSQYKIIFVLVAVGIVTKNIVTYSSYMFQITNRISKYVFLTIAQRLTYGVVIGILLVCKVNDFYWYCIADLCGDLVGFVIGMIFNRGLYLGKTIAIRETLRELKTNVFAGIILMLANWSSVLIIGSAKMIIQWHWDELMFGKVSFAFSVSNVFLTFVSAISVVLFPSLKRIDEDKLPQMYKSIRDILSPVLFIVMLFYFPGCWVLNRWLPKYANSLMYLGIILPIIIYSSKVSLLTNNYLKVYRKEKSLLLVNFISIVVGVILFVLSAYVFDNLIAVIASVVVATMFKSVLSEIFVCRIVHVNLVKDFIIEAIMTVGFILCAWLLNLWIGCLVYFGLVVVYCAIYYKSIKVIFGRVFKRKKNSALNEPSTDAASADTEQVKNDEPIESAENAEIADAIEQNNMEISE